MIIMIIMIMVTLSSSSPLPGTIIVIIIVTIIIVIINIIIIIIIIITCVLNNLYRYWQSNGYLAPGWNSKLKQNVATYCVELGYYLVDGKDRLQTEATTETITGLV